MLKSLIVVGVIVSLALSVSASFSETEVEILFTQWAAKNGKEYAHDGLRQFRRTVFHDNLKFVSEHNALFKAGHRTYEVALNEHADLTLTEFQRLMQMQEVDISEVERLFSLYAQPHIDGAAPVASSKDWRQEGAVTKVKNQGQCGSCWSFSATGSLEAAWFLAGNTLTPFSEQQLVDCSTSYGNMGCNGGLPSWGFEYAIDSGMETETAYPYTARGPLNCQYNKDKVVAHFTSYTNVTSGSESDLQNAVGTVSPVSVGIDASHMSFQFYSKGVYNEPSCSASRLDHGVLTVGYDATESGQQYWIVKNSWGASWGNQGYIWMSRNANNQCGIATMANYPTV